MVDDNGDEEICEAHAGEHQSRERTERPERHLDLTFRLPRALDRKVQADARHDQRDRGECSEENDENLVRQRGAPSSF